MAKTSGGYMAQANQRSVDHGTTTEAAARWCTRLHAEDCTPAERVAFERWLTADPLRAEHYRTMAHLWEAADLLPRPGAPRKTLRNLYAGGVLGLLVLLLAGWAGWSHGWLPTHYQSFESGGSRQQVLLADGSKVELNLNSRLVYTSYINERRVTLKAGEAFFEVRQDGGQPFVVRAGQGQAKVDGPRFNVWKYRDEVRLTPVEGSLIVSSHPGSEGYRLWPGMQARYKAGDFAPQLDPVYPGDRTLAWRHGRLVLDNLPLADALPLINRYLDKPLVLADHATGTIRIGGVFDTADIGKLVGSLPRMLAVYLTRNKAGGTVLNSISPRPEG